MKRQTYLFATLLSLFLVGFVFAPTQAQAFQLFPGEDPTGDFRNYVLNFYTFSIAAGTLIATVLIMIGGMIWVTSAGNPSRIELAKSYIIDSIIGVVLLMSAVVLLRLINPALVELPKITPAPLVGPSGACIYPDPTVTYSLCQTTAEIVCKESLKGNWQAATNCDDACPRIPGGKTGECKVDTYTGQPLQKSNATCPNNKVTTTSNAEENLMLLACNSYCNPKSLQPNIPGYCKGGISDIRSINADIINLGGNRPSYVYNCTCT